ncbi:MAG TPA: DNA polymerase III subunit gamma/tau [Alphaproteobacteria bacterium]|nr:DNA polymerase III subunit gamma/tau [Alphaproteobacteria bacterium]HQS93137.1 DNA polymerase III subunit gamma/tau [Alphaproteobacteria bacterium]
MSLQNSSVSNSPPISQESKGSYQVLARKWRPQAFKDVIGQEVMIQILSNALKSDRLGHAFILTGERGVGKTTTARILARAINCVGRSLKDTVEPCGVCGPCVDILEERHLDVIEMDAASHTSVDDIREIISSCRYLPSSAAYKVYIIDEVHMLSKNAFNALLKTLEEPPPHVKFIFATTEIHKVPITILSRCCRFDLKRISTEAMGTYLKSVVAQEESNVEDDAIALIARFADGSLRDAMSLLDQALNMFQRTGEGSAETSFLTANHVRDMVGAFENAEIITLFEALHRGEISKTLKMTENFYQKGGDTARLMKDLLDVTYILSRLKVDPMLDLGLRTKEDQAHLQALSKALSVPVLQRTWQILSKGWEEVRSSPIAALALQMVLMRLGYIQDLPPLHSWPSFSQIEKQEDTKADTKEMSVDLSEETPVQRESQEVKEERPIENGENIISFENLEEISDFLLKHKEIRLYTLLYQEAHLIEMKDGSLTLRLNFGEDTKSHLQLARVLTTLTHRKWTVHLSQETGQATLREKKEALEKARLVEAQQDPLVQEVLKTFKEARVEKIIDEPKEE